MWVKLAGCVTAVLLADVLVTFFFFNDGLLSVTSTPILKNKSNLC